MCSLRLENDFHRRYVVRNNDRGILRPALSPPPLSFLFSTPIYVSPGSTLACPRCVSPGTRLHPFSLSLSLCTLQLKTSLLIDPVATAARPPLPLPPSSAYNTSWLKDPRDQKGYRENPFPIDDVVPSSNINTVEARL